ncbi:alpha-2,8-polysialyltransferase family protein [Gammaproteobacteria bacterium]|jgi:hypothetical protein|nr:alpha-2,8-polysialyltransferase family protein [Gammaproteobacteria bacterium]
MLENRPSIVCLCESPLQLLNIIEYSLRHGCIGTVLIRLNGNKANEYQFEEVLKYNKFLKPEYFCLGRKEYNLSKYFMLLIKHISKIRNIECLVVGDPRALWIKLLSWASGKKRIIIVDDGAYTISLANQSEDFFEIFWYRYFIDIIFFTSFNLGKTRHDIIENDYTEIRKSTLSSLENKKNIGLFIGSAYSESNVVSLEYEMNSIKKALQQLGPNGEMITYVCHRRDALEKIEKIRVNFPHINVLETEEPIELFLLKTCAKVNVLSGFYSTALNNIPRFVECKTLICFRFCESEITPKFRDRIRDSYNNLVTNCHFNIREL